ncbi:MAG: hypothetical protein HQL51_01675 [Magnetococcales bacterium]|nr:hypothetical protein [Magnetococcales bacterium]
MPWIPPAGTSVHVTLTGGGYDPPPGGAVPLTLVRVNESVHRTRLAVLVGAEHRVRLDLLALEAVATAEHRTRLDLLVLEAVAAAEHRACLDLRERVAAVHHTRLKLLLAGYEVEAEHRVRLAVLVGVEHRARVELLALESLAAAEHRARLALLVGGEHGIAVRDAVEHEHRARLDLLNLEAVAAADHRARLDLLNLEALATAEHRAKLAVLVGGEHRARLAVLFLVAREHGLLLDIKAPAAAEHRARLDLLAGDPATAEHRAKLAVLVGAEHRARLSALEPTVAEHRTRLDLLPYDPVFHEHGLRLALHDALVEIITDQPALTHQGRTVALLAAEIRADDGSFTWLADLKLADLDDWRRVRVGDAVTVDLYGEVFALVVDQKAKSREKAGVALSLGLLAVSPLAMRRERVTLAWSGAVDARQAVEEILGEPVTWTLPDWTIPAGRLAAERADPVDLARQIAGAAGGVLESNPDGSVVCRPRFPLAVPQWAAADPAHVLTDDEVMSEFTSYSPVEFTDRLAVADADPSAGGDEVEALDLDGEPHRKLLHVYPSPWRPLQVVHTGDAAVILESLGVREREESELIQILGGTGRTRYPVAGIVATSWQYLNLGPVSFDPDSREIVADVAGASLLRITYRTRCQAWAASDVRDESILFLVME